MSEIWIFVDLPLDLSWIQRCHLPREARISLTRKEKEDGMYCMDGIQLSWLDLIIFFLLFFWWQGQVKGIVKGERVRSWIFFCSYFFLHVLRSMNA